MKPQVGRHDAMTGDAPIQGADPHRVLLDYYDERLRRHGDTAAGAAWPNEADRRLRFEVMTEDLCAAAPAPVVCDLGCGTGELLAYLRGIGRGDIGYIGADRSALALGYARRKFPEARWLEIDVSTASESDLAALACDYLVANGLFTVRHSLSTEAMWAFLTGVIRRLWPHVRRGIAFNVMSPVVDWERDDLFHASHDRMAVFLHELAGRRMQMRADYGLYEYTCLAFKADAEPVPVAVTERVTAYRPRLPDAQSLAPYLRRIDGTRIYSNHGPLVAELEQRLGERFGLGPQQLVCAASGTAALVAGILATAGRATPERPYALCPAYTFVGTASALEQCGYTPWLVDVDPETWQMDPAAMLAHPMLPRVGVVVPVAAYGRAVPSAGWERFRQASGVAVVIDAAASFEALLHDPLGTIGSLPVALSFHATKAFATGEGGALVTRDGALSRAAFRSLNFGFLMERVSRAHSINGKMSEHHAAVGLASLEQWPRHHQALCAVAAAYRAAFASRGLDQLLVCHPDVASNYVLLRLPEASAACEVARALEAGRIESRLWYGPGLHGQPVFADLPRDDLAVTDRLAGCVLGLPVTPDLDAAVVERIADVACGALR